MQRQPHHAVKFAKKAAACDPEQAGLPLVTLAQAYLDLGQTRPARRAAEMATRQGMTLGYQVLAATTGTPRPKVPPPPSVPKRNSSPGSRAKTNDATTGSPTPPLRSVGPSSPDSGRRPER
jgi:hypothetical protein